MKELVIIFTGTEFHKHRAGSIRGPRAKRDSKHFENVIASTTLYDENDGSIRGVSVIRKNEAAAYFAVGNSYSDIGNIAHIEVKA